MQNTSPQCHAIIQGRPCQSSTYSSYLLLDSNESPIETLPPGKDGTLLISLPNHLLIHSTPIQVCIDCSWTLSPDDVVSPWITRQLVCANDAHPLESFIIMANHPCKWEKLDDLVNYTEEEAVSIKTLASVCFYTHRFPEIALHTFREIFPKFEILDYGYWQLLNGREEFSGILVSSFCKNNGVLDVAYGRSSAQLEALMNKLKGNATR